MPLSRETRSTRVLGAATAAVALGLVTAAPAVLAQAFDAVRLYSANPGSDGGTVGAALIAGWRYAGSDQRRTSLLPLIDYQWADGWFAGVSNGIGYNFSSEAAQNYGVRVTADLGRPESRSTALKGLGDIKMRPEIGGFFNTYLDPSVVATTSLRLGSGNDRNGLLVDLGLVYASQIQPQWRLAIGGAATLANAQYLQSYFGVTGGQSATSGYASYTPSAGLRDVRLNGSLTYFIDRRLTVTGALSASSLQGDAKRSPLVRQRTGTSAVAALSYAF